MKPLLDPIAQKGYAYAFDDWLPKMLENNATALVGMEQDAQKQRKEDAAKKEALERQQKTERIANQRLLAAQRPELAGVYLPDDEKRLREKMPKYIELMGAATNTNALDNPELYRQMEDLGMDIQLEEAKARKRYEKAFANEAELMQNPDKYENTVNDLHANVAGYGDHVAKGGNPDEYQFMGLKPKVNPYNAAEFEKLVMSVVPKKKTERKVMGKPYTILGDTHQKEQTETIETIDPEEVAKVLRDFYNTDPRAKMTIDAFAAQGQNVQMVDGKPTYNFSSHGLNLANKYKAEPIITGEHIYTKARPQTSGGGGGYSYNSSYGYGGKKGSRFIAPNMFDVETIDPIENTEQPRTYDLAEIPFAPIEAADGGYLPIYYKDPQDGHTVSLDVHADKSGDNAGRADRVKKRLLPSLIPKGYEVADATVEKTGFVNMYQAPNGTPYGKNFAQGYEDRDIIPNVKQNMGGDDYLGKYPYGTVTIKLVKKDEYGDVKDEKYVHIYAPLEGLSRDKKANVIPTGISNKRGTTPATKVQKAETNAKKSMNDIFNRNK